MASFRGRLTAAFVRTCSTPGEYDDARGHGLRLRVSQSGAKYFLQRYRFGGRRPEIGLGPYPVVSLEAAREQAVDNLRIVRSGDDPIARRRREQVPTFAEAAARVVEQRRSVWKGGKSEQVWISSFERFVFPVFGQKLVSHVTPKDVLEVLEPIWTDKAETAGKLRHRISVAMQWAVTKGYREGDPAGTHVLTALPRRKRVRQHFRALPHAKVAWAVATVRATNAHEATKLAFEFLVLTAARSGEIRLATWPEIDFDARVWRIAGERMKTGQPHDVPLAGRAVELLKRAKQLCGGSELLFPSPKGGTISDVTHTKLLRENGVDAVPHGFRSSFRDWCGETGVPRELAEIALAHVVANQVEAAYARSDLLERRRPIMEDWARYVSGPSDPESPDPQGQDGDAPVRRASSRTRRRSREAPRHRLRDTQAFSQGRLFDFEG